MKKYIGTKVVEAEPAYRSGGKVYPKSGSYPRSMDLKDGYRVRYPDGYESWSPKDTFEEAYRPADGLNFGLALEAMKKGIGARLPQWKEDVVIRAQFPDACSKMTAPYLYVESRFGRVPWKETMIELFSDQWQIVE